MPGTPKLPLSRRAALLGLAAAAVTPRPACAAPQPAALDPAQRADVARIQAYLNGIRTMESRFEQVADDGGVSNGTIYLSRPGNLRIVYDPPVPILIVATGGELYYYDSKLQQVSRTYTNDTPAWFLLRDPITLGGYITVTGFQRRADALRISMVETKNTDLGQVTVVFTDQPLELRQWTIIDPQRKQVTVTLLEPKFDIALDPNLFYWTNPLPAGASP